MNTVATLHSNAAIVVRPIVLARAMWARSPMPGGLGLKPIKGTWFAHMDKSGGGASVVLPMISCPSCAKMLFLTPTQETARVLGRMLQTIVPVAHSIDTVGKVSPDIRCAHPGCSFHRTVYLDKWDRLRPLYVTAYTEGVSPDLKFAYSHAASQKEARFHLGSGDFNIISVGRAVGVLFDEKTGKVSTD
jgi:hypothetical protein